MRPEPNNDIDLLLRQLSRRNGVPVSENQEQHLDADELNSFVANALPAAARARYTEHLADCSSCRKLVAQLSASHGLLPVQQSEGSVAPSGLKSFLASLFSPMVLRFAVPALGLIVIAAIGVFVLQREKKGSSVAQVSDTNQTRPAITSLPKDAAPGSSPTVSEDVESTGITKTEAPQQGPAAAPAAKDAPARAATQPAKEEADAVDTIAEAPPPAPKAAAPTVAKEPAPASADVRNQNKDQAARQSKALAVEDRREPIKQDYNSAGAATETATPGTTTRRDVQVRAAKGGEPASGGASTGAGGDLKRAPAEKEKKALNLSSAETRSVAGRQFRKSAGVWIDTAYDESKSITTVARGSEQYRALVGDEPRLREIADQLEGEIVVVWKGRTYRIR